MTTSPCIVSGRPTHWIQVALLTAAFCSTAVAQTAPQITWYTLAGSDFNPTTNKAQTAGIQVFLHSTDSRVVAFRATAAAQLGAGLGAPAAQGTATDVLEDTDTMVYIPVTPYTANVSLQTLWVLVELFLEDGTTFSSIQRLPAPFQSYPITIPGTSPATHMGEMRGR